MQAVEDHTSVEPGLMRALARHLEHLYRHPDGGKLHQLINNALLHCRNHGYVNGSCIAHLHQRILDFTKDNAQPFPIRIRARLIQQHLAMYLPRPEQHAPATAAKHTPLTPSPARPADPVASRAGMNISKDLPKHDPNHQVKTKLTESAAMESQATPDKNITLVAQAREAQGGAGQAKAQNLDELRKIVTKSMDEIVRDREVLTRKLSDANSYLKMIEAEREQLRVDLNKARKRTRTIEKSPKKLGLPKRDVLILQIKAEVERVKRHGNSLALALIDIDNLETINNQHGQEAADAVLHHYTSEILGSFRSYDLVARYNKDEFAVLLPNTDKDNAMRALEKVRKRASESHFTHKGRSYPLPGFGGVLTFYTPGEESHQMLRRADEALVNLKLRGERQVVIV